MMTTAKIENEPEKCEDYAEVACKEISSMAKSNLKGDWLNFFLLLLLYTMQGLPLGISTAIPVLLQSKKNTSYQEQALFSLTIWPFSLKLLWAPLVDALYVQRIGRRKSWLIPVQYLIGAILFYLGNNIDDLFPETGKSNVVGLTKVFIISNFLAATQDIAVDGWALTMLKKNNVGYASTCNSLGQSFGILIGSTVPILFTSEDFCNKYLRNTSDVGGVLTMKSFLYFCGIVFMTITTLIAIFKRENDCSSEENHVKLTTVQNYTLIWDMIQLPSIRMLVLAMFTVKAGFAATDSVSIFKLIDAGVSKDDISLIHTAIFVLNIIMPIVIAKYTSGPKPMNAFLKVIPFRLPWNIIFAIFIYYTPQLIKINGVVNVPTYYYAILTLVLIIQQILPNIMFVAVMAFFSRISDSRFGGTYMTLLNTVANLGYVWTSTVALEMIDFLTFNYCSTTCSTTDLQNTCNGNKDNCIKTINGYYVETIICTILGIGWYLIFKNTIKKLQGKDPSRWLVDVE